MGVTSSPEKNWNQKKKRKKKGKENNPFHETVNREFFLPSTRLFHGTEFHDGSNFNVGVNVINAYQLPPPPPPPLFSFDVSIEHSRAEPFESVAR